MSIDLQKNRSDILKAYDDVLNDKSSTDWILLGYEGQTNVLKLVGTGDGGLEELADDLNSSKVMYAVVRVTDPKTTRTKLVLINWIGEGAPTLRKGVCARHLPEVKDMFRGVNVTVNARNEEEVEADQVYAALGRATATSYDFSERSDHEEKNNPVGTNYQRTNPLSEINTNSRNMFWEQQEQEERRRKQEEMKRKQEESEMLEKERKKKEVESSSVRDAVVAQRTERIMEQRRATEVAEQRCRAASGGSGGGEGDVPDNQEVERSKRAELMRKERKLEAESVIGHSTKSARSLFESQQHQQQPLAKSNSNSSVGGSCGGGSRPPPRKLKDFTPLNQTDVNGDDVAAPAAPSIGGRGTVGRVWPPPSNSTGAPTLTEERKVPHRMFGSEGSPPPPPHRSNQSELRNGGTATAATSSSISSSVAPSGAAASVAVGRRQDPIGGNAMPASASSVFTNNTSPQHPIRQPPPSTGYVKGAETKTTPLPELPLYAQQQQRQQQQQQQMKSPSRDDQPHSPVVKENVGSNFKSNDPEQSPPLHRVAEGEAACKDKAYEASDERFSLSAQHHQKQQRKQQHSSPVQEDDHRYEGIQANNTSAVYNTNNNSINPSFSSAVPPAIHSSPESSRTPQLPSQQLQQEQPPPPVAPSQRQDRQSVGGYLPSDVRTNGAAAASAAPSVGRITSNGGSNNQSHLYDDVPGDDDSDRICDSPDDGVKSGAVSAAEDALSPGPASPRVESTPSVAMTCEVDGIEYQLLPERGLCARALCDYQASDDTEISFDPSEIISNIEQIDEGWWRGVGPNGDFGLFPANYVELISAASPHTTS